MDYAILYLSTVINWPTFKDDGAHVGLGKGVGHAAIH